MASPMDVFDEFITELLKDPSIDRSYVDIFPLCSTSIAVQSLYIVRLINMIRRPFYPGYDFRVGFIGCGTVGSLMLQTLLSFSGLKPSRFMVSSRRPETLQKFQQDGVFVCFDNQKVYDECDLIFVTTLPFQLRGVTGCICPRSPPLRADSMYTATDSKRSFFNPEETFQAFMKAQPRQSGVLKPSVEPSAEVCTNAFFSSLSHLCVYSLF
jgi:hypothetical protein